MRLICRVRLPEREHFFYLGGYVDYNTYIASDEWKQKVNEAKEYYGDCCLLCGSNAEIHVHHRHYRSLGNEDMHDLTILCDKCHYRYHFHISDKKPKSYRNNGKSKDKARVNRYKLRRRKKKKKKKGPGLPANHEKSKRRMEVIKQIFHTRRCRTPKEKEIHDSLKEELRCL
jgi:hypothetical protein